MTFRKPFLLVVIVLMGILMTACALGTAATPNETNDNIVTMFVGPEKADCVGVAPMECLQVKYSENEAWQFFYSNIEGFTYEPGYLYELRVRQEAIANPPADGSSIRWVLVEEVNKTPVTDTSSSSLNDTHWTLVEFGDGTVPNTGTDVTLSLSADGSATGNGSINRYNGSYTIEGNSLTFSPFVSTKMGGDPALMAQESAYLGVLARTVTFQVDDAMLSVFDGDGTLLLTFQSA